MNAAPAAIASRSTSRGSMPAGAKFSGLLHPFDVEARTAAVVEDTVEPARAEPAEAETEADTDAEARRSPGPVGPSAQSPQQTSHKLGELTRSSGIGGPVTADRPLGSRHGYGLVAPVHRRVPLRCGSVATRGGLGCAPVRCPGGARRMCGECRGAPVHQCNGSHGDAGREHAPCGRGLRAAVRRGSGRSPRRWRSRTVTFWGAVRVRTTSAECCLGNALLCSVGS